jgi:hypothetical protein
MEMINYDVTIEFGIHPDQNIVVPVNAPDESNARMVALQWFTNKFPALQRYATVMNCV